MPPKKTGKVRRSPAKPSLVKKRPARSPARTETPSSSFRRRDVLARVLATFTATLDIDEVLRGVVKIALEVFAADRAFLLYPVDLESEFATVTFEAARSGYQSIFGKGEPVPLTTQRRLIARALDEGRPLVVEGDDPDVDQKIRAAAQIETALLQVLRPGVEGLWVFGLHQKTPRSWTPEDIDLFEEVGRFATLAIHNAQTHRHAVVETAKVNAILDQIPEAAAIYDQRGNLLRMNDAALRERSYMFELNPDARVQMNRPRQLDGQPISAHELPSQRALRGETVKSELVVTDSRTEEDRILSIRAAPIRDVTGGIFGSIVLATDVTEERRKIEQDTWRRRRAECLASLALVTQTNELADMNQAASTIAKSIAGNVQIFFYRQQTDLLELAGSHFSGPEGKRFRDYLIAHPFRPGEGLPGTVFALGKPLMFAGDVSEALADTRRNTREVELGAALNEESVIAHPVEAYGSRIGVIVLSHSDARRRFGAEDLAFAQAVSDRIGASHHIFHLTRLAQEGHRAAEELARREVDARARLEAVLDSAPVGVAVISADELRFEMANPLWVEFASRYGKITRDDRIIGLRVAEVIPRLEYELQGAAETGEPRVDNEVELRTQSSTSIFKRIISPVRGRLSGQTQSLTILVQDVTEQVRTRREIEALIQLMEERTARLDSILGSMTDALWVYDSAGNVIDVNPAAVGMFGLASRGDAIAHGSLRQLQLRYPDGRTIPPEEMPYARALRGETVPDYLAVARNLISGRDLDLSIAVAPIESGGVVGAVLVMRDITGLQELDRKKDEFLSVASHELRTPLTTVKGYSQLLAQSVNELDPEERVTYLRAILGEIDRMMGLISELLDVSRIETNRLMLDRQPTRWGDLIERQVTSFRLQNPKRQILVNFDVADVILPVDPLRMRQVIDNLVSNALKYSPESSNIEITVTQGNGVVCTAVTDYGIGIPQDEISQLFERFHRARNVSSRYYGGLGLGLYIARAIVEAHGGTVSVTSEEGKGSTFTVVLPLKVEAEEPTPDQPPQLTQSV